MSQAIFNSKTLLGSTVAPLGGGASYTSPVYPSNTMQRVTGICQANQAGTLAIEFSADGTNFYGSTSTTYAANDALNFNVDITAPFFRVKFTNGIAAQASFNLYFWSNF